MRYPSIRNPEGFDDIFPVFVIYAVLVGFLVRFSDSAILHSGYVIGTIIICSWIIWATLQVLDVATEEEGDSPGSRDE